MQLSEYNKKIDECNLIREMMCSTSKKAGKRARRGSLLTVRSDIKCVKHHRKYTFINAIKTAYYGVIFPYEIYNMPDFTEIDGEPTVNKVKDMPMTKKQKKELKEYKNKKAGDRKVE
jgi:hypothetical protein